MAQLEIRHVTRRFGDFVALDDINLTIAAGEFFTLLGPSGCGKTTLLRLIAGFDLPDAGQILLDGQDLLGIPAEQRPIHTVFQSYALFPHMSVAQNVTFPLRMAGVAAAEIQPRLHEVLAQMRLSDKIQHYPQQLSGGEKQRVALARALINRPQLLLLDESLAALDAKLRKEVQLELIHLQREVGIAFIFVTHAQDEALALSHRIAVMNRGRVEQVDEPNHLYAHPNNRFVADFIGHINLLPAQVVARESSHVHLQVSGIGELVCPRRELLDSDSGLFAIRPEQLRMSRHHDLQDLKNHFSGTVLSVLYHGDTSLYKVQLAQGGQLDVLLPNAAPNLGFRIGESVNIAWRHDIGAFLHD